MRSITVLAHNIRSTHNIGALLRTCDGFGVEQVIFSGYSPYPTLPHDPRLPHIAAKLTAAIAKTALGAEQLVAFSYSESIETSLANLKKAGYRIVALEQTADSTLLSDYQPSLKTALLIGEEVHGITPSLLALCDEAIEIPMFGKKESFNVSVASGIALYHLRCQ